MKCKKSDAKEREKKSEFIFAHRKLKIPNFIISNKSTDLHKWRKMMLITHAYMYVNIGHLVLFEVMLILVLPRGEIFDINN